MMESTATDSRESLGQEQSIRTQTPPNLTTTSQPRADSSESSEEGAGLRKSSTRKKLKRVARKLVAPVRPFHQSPSNDKPDLNHVRHEAAFNPSKVEKELTRRHGKAARLADRTRAAAEDGVNLALHPKSTIGKKIKNSAVSRFSPTKKQYASKADELKYLEAQYSAHSTDGESTEELDPKVRGEILEERRDSIRTAWTTSHLRRIRVVRPQPRPFPTRASCTYRIETQEAAKVDWMKWIGHLMLYLTQSFTPMYLDDWEELPFDLVSTRNHLERIVLSSSHWQAWAMDVRSVYRWENPKRTARWLALYVVLWYTSRIPTFLWGYIIYRVVSNRFQERTLENVRRAARRAMDRETTAFQLGELIDRHGQEEWVDQLIQQVGPYAQLQLDDMANALEVLHNFYAWKDPMKTFWSLTFFASCLACCLFTDMEYCMRIVWLILGTSFFFAWPVSSCYPQYRLLVSPLKWIFWGIPTHADLAFSFLRKHADISRREMIQKRKSRQADQGGNVLDHYAGKMSTSDTTIRINDEEGDVAESSSDDDDWQSTVSTASHVDEGDMLGFRAHCEGVSGRVYISPEGIHFDRNHPREQMWNIPWTELSELWKAGLQGRRKVTIHGLFDSGILQLRSLDGQVHTLDPIKYRDEAFNCIIGFSRLQWTEVPTEPGKGRKPEKEKKTE